MTSVVAATTGSNPSHDPESELSNADLQQLSTHDAHQNSDREIADTNGGDGSEISQEGISQKACAVLATLQQLGTYMGPGFLISVAYMDPGNWATNIAAGASFDTKLLWVIVLASLIAMCIQIVCAKLGIATGKNVAILCREHFPRTVVFILWAAAELAMIATDMAEIIGAALGFQLVFHLPLWAGAILAAVFSFALIGIRGALSQGFRVIELVVMAFVAFIALIFLVELLYVKPAASLVFSGLKPSIPDSQALLLAIGILGATVMPHSIYLHPDILQDRRESLMLKHGDNDQVHRMHLRFESAETILALTGAMFVNAAMLIVAAGALSGTGIDTVEDAYVTLQDIFGNSAGVLFGLALIAAGLSSSLVATMAGQSVMDGFLNWNVNIWIRRSVTLLPSLAIVLAGLEATDVLVASQVALSFELPFVLIPLVYFTQTQNLMGNFVNSKTTTALLCLIVGFIVALNIWLILTLAIG